MSGEADQVMAGGVNEVARVGATVRRPAGPWSPAVQALLEHLARAGFGGAPRAHGIDGRGREVLEFVEGEVPDYPLPQWAVSDAALRGVGALLRAFHDATVGFVPPPDAVWYFEPREPAEVVCHGDAAPYNVVFRGGRPAGLIDFDTAHPGPRVWDLAYTAYRFAPLSAPDNADFTLPVADQARRLRTIADAYGLGEGDRRALPDVAVARLRHLVEHIRGQAAAGHPAFSEHLAAGHDRGYLGDAAHIERHRSVFVSSLV